MNFVDDVDFETTLCRLVANVLDNLANFINATIRGAVNLKHVDGISLRNLIALAALVARGCRRSFVTVQCLGKNASSGSFAHSANSGKKISMRDTADVHGL